MVSGNSSKDKAMSVPDESIFLPAFFARPTLEVAGEFLGATLHRRLPDGSIFQASVVEIEAYTADDPACHAAAGKTERCAVMFGPPGLAYVYFIYGMYFCLNVVTEQEGIAGAILIRALAAEGCDGPGKLCRELAITREQNGLNLLCPEGELWLSAGTPPANPGVSKRIGISKAADRLWRFFDADSKFLSVKEVKPVRRRKHT